MKINYYECIAIKIFCLRRYIMYFMNKPLVMKKQLFLVLFCLFFSCKKSTKQSTLSSEELYKQKCSMCHITPSIDALPKHLWKNLLPEIVAKMGLIEPGYSPIGGMSAVEIDAVIASGIYTGKPTISEAEWQQLKSYILKNAPDSINKYKRDDHKFELLSDFITKKVDLDGRSGSFITFLSYIDDKLYYSDLFGGLYTYDFKLNKSNLYKQFNSAIVWYEKLENDVEIFTEIGKLDPSEQKLGSIWVKDESVTERKIASNIHRPVHSLSKDLNNDGNLQHVIAEFGHLTGSINLINSKNNESLLLWPKPGGILTKTCDLNNDGLIDLVSLVAQGDEAIMGFIQEENGNFYPEYLVRYPPNYGSSWFELVDFDDDGDLDLITVHGDNADKTYTQKPYHGMRISLNDGTGNFEESFFYQLNGATRVLTEDFDQDNDIDIALVSTFPDYENESEMAFVYLENLGGYQFKERIIEEVDLGRWFLLEKGDVDKDGDIDLLVSSFTYVFSPVPDNFTELWKKSTTDLLVLENQLVK